MEVACRTVCCVSSSSGSATLRSAVSASHRTGTTSVKGFTRSHVRAMSYSSGAISTDFLKGNATGALGRRLAVASTVQSQKAAAGGIRCMAEGDDSKTSIDTWLGRVAMLAFVGALGLEVTTGKGLLETIGVTAPLPAIGLGIVAVAGGVTAFGIFRSSQD